MSGLIDMLARRGANLSSSAERGTLLTLDDLRAGAPRAVVQAAVRARCQTVTIDAHTVLCRVLGKYKFFADSRDIGLSPHLMLDGYWEMWCTEFMLGRIRPGQTVWDVGANLGYYAVLMADLVGPQGKVVALEPNPRLALLCERSLALNGYWHTASVKRVAAADQSDATVRFRAALADPKNGHVLFASAPRPANEHDDDTLEVAVRTLRLDDIADAPVDFVKIDVEGAEERVWAGMQGVLDRSPEITVLMEFNAFRCQAPEKTLREIAGRFALRELGFDAALHTVTVADVLARREDTLLVLTRGA
jgi:FkbM family methyltransferase